MDTNKYYIAGGQQGAVGDNASAQHFTQQQVIAGESKPLNLHILAEELGKIASSANDKATDSEHYIAIGSIQAAKAAAEKGDASKTLTYLKSAGTWALDIATDIGAKTVAELIKTQLGLT